MSASAHHQIQPPPQIDEPGEDFFDLQTNLIPGTDRHLPEQNYTGDMPHPDSRLVASALDPLVTKVQRELFEPLGAFVGDLISLYPQYGIREGWLGISDVSLEHGIQVRVHLCREDQRYDMQFMDFLNWVDTAVGYTFGSHAHISVCGGASPFVSDEDSPKLPREERPELWRRFFLA